MPHRTWSRNPSKYHGISEARSSIWQYLQYLTYLQYLWQYLQYLQYPRYPRYLGRLWQQAGEIMHRQCSATAWHSHPLASPSAVPRREGRREGASWFCTDNRFGSLPLPGHMLHSSKSQVRSTQPKLQKRAFSAYEHKHWILMRAERAGALPGHARSALAGHRTRGAR